MKWKNILMTKSIYTNHKILTVGHACLDIVHQISKLPHLDNKTPSNNLNIRIGGNAANAAAALVDLGARAGLCTVLGSHSHPFTRVLVSLLMQQNIDISFCDYNDSLDCSCSTILVTPDGKRTIVNFQNENLKSTMNCPQTLENISLVMGDNYRLPMVRQVFSLASASNIPTMLDIDDIVNDISALPECNYAWLSYEAYKSLNKSLQDIQTHTRGLVGVTNGEHAVIWIDRHGHTNSYVPHYVQPINTLGAGDVFRARFAIEICQAMSIEDAVQNSCFSAIEHIQGQNLTPVYKE
jgi:sugar/nucleoside kinase (ribokinase family)